MSENGNIQNPNDWRARNSDIQTWLAQFEDGLTWSEFLNRPDLWK